MGGRDGIFVVVVLAGWNVVAIGFEGWISRAEDEWKMDVRLKNERWWSRVES